MIGEFKNDRQINQEILKASNNSSNNNNNNNNNKSWKALQLMCKKFARVCCGRSASCFTYGFVFQVIRLKALCSKDFVDSLRGIFI